MSEEFPSDPEIKSVEATLRSMGLPASPVDRDELMYQAGWAAARNEFGVGNDLASQHGVWKWVMPALGLCSTAAALTFFALFMASRPDSDTSRLSEATPDLPMVADAPESKTITPEFAESNLRRKLQQERLRLVTSFQFGAELTAGSSLPGTDAGRPDKQGPGMALTAAKSNAGLLNELLGRRQPVSFGE